MKRISLVLDERLLEEATRALGVKTYSAAVNRALADAVRVRNVQGLREAFGHNFWVGDLSEMRDDRPRGGARAGRTQARKPR